MNQTWLRIVFTALVFLGLTFGVSAEEATVDIRFWAYSSNPEFFAYQTTNHDGAEVFVVGKAGEDEPAYVQTADEENSPRDILISREMRDIYGWNADGSPGNPSPSGYTELTVNETGATLTITARQAGRVSPIGAIQRRTDATQTVYAEVRLHEVMWSPDETVAVVIIEQVVEGDWSERIQTAHGFAIPERPSSD